MVGECRRGPNRPGEQALGPITTKACIASGSYSSQQGRRRPRLDISSAVGNVGRRRAAADIFLERLAARRIVVDYEKSVFEVCRDFLKFVFRSSSSLDMICKPWAPRDSSLPTWIPQLTGSAFGPTSSGIHRRINADSLVMRQGSRGTGLRPYNASRSLIADWSLDNPESKKFVEAFKKKYNELPDQYAGEAYDGLAWWLAHVEKQKTFDKEALTGKHGIADRRGFRSL